MRPPAPDENERAEVKAAILRDLRDFSPELADEAASLIERVATPNWSLEWGLPRWLGHCFQLPPEITRELVLSNVCGLAFARLTDDLTDGEYDATSGPGHDPHALAVVLQHLWTMRYAYLVDRHPERLRGFWNYFHQYMREWTSATCVRNRGLPTPFSSYTAPDFLNLAWRGAPLKTCCAAACLWARHLAHLDRLAAAVDDTMIGVVLLDDVFDWREDLEAGRYNSFVAYCSTLAQTAEHRDANREAVMREVHFVRRARPYFDVIAARLEHAQAGAVGAGCVELSDFAAWLAGESATCGEWLAREAETRVREAAESLGGSGEFREP